MTIATGKNENDTRAERGEGAHAWSGVTDDVQRLNSFIAPTIYLTACQVLYGVWCGMVRRVVEFNLNKVSRQAPR